MIIEGDYKDHVFHEVEGRCALPSDWIPSGVDVHTFARQRGWQVLAVDVEEVARRYIGHSRYELRASEALAPHVVDCSGFIKWVFAQAGILLPRLAVQQRQIGRRVDDGPWLPGDLLFRTARQNYTDPKSKDEVGHVGMVLRDGRIIHASARSRTVEAVDYKTFEDRYQYRGACRILPEAFVTLQLRAQTDQPRWTATRVCGLLRRLRSQEDRNA